MIVLVINYLHMVKINAREQFLLCLGMFEITNDWTRTWSSEFESRKCELEFAYLIVALISMKTRYKVLDTCFQFVMVWM